MREAWRTRAPGRATALCLLGLAAACDGGPSEPPANLQPTVEIGVPSDGAVFPIGAVVHFTATATDQEDGILPDSALVWHSDLDGLLGIGTDFTRSDLSVGVHRVTLSGTDAHGATGTDASTITIAANQPPAVLISAPNDSAVHQVGAVVQFTATATDQEDGALPDSALVWHSDLDGPLGTGRDFTRSDLSLGVHTITLIGTDAHGAADTATRIIGVAAPLAFRAIATGFALTCALDLEGHPWCWGFSVEDLAVNPWTADIVPYPVRVGGDQTFVDIVAGNAYACGLTEAGGAYCWGFSQDGATGNPGSASSAVPIEVAGDHTFLQITSGAAHTCGLDAAGEAWCWGYNEHGQVGAVSGGATPVPVVGGHQFVQLSAGFEHTCGRTAEGDVYCWGDNGSGELGTGGGSSHLPGLVTGGHTFASISAGRHAETCGITVDGRNLCWGSNHFGQLGIGPDSARVHAPTEMTVGRYSSIHPGAWSCGLDGDGAAYCWGNNSLGNLGDGSTINSYTALPVQGNHRFATLVVGSTACGITEDGRAYCWGRNSAGTVGDGTVEHRAGPTPVIAPLVSPF